jgi:hypothetical protein
MLKVYTETGCSGIYGQPLRGFRPQLLTDIHLVWNGVDTPMQYDGRDQRGFDNKEASDG